MAEQIQIESFFSSANHKLIIRDIFAMYHHKWDVIGETIQNAVDSVLKRAEEAPAGYKPAVKIGYNARTMEISVEDNGTGISREEMKRIAAPHVSLKSPAEASRGEFGVGLTFAAFSSNHFKLESTCGQIRSSLEIQNAYSWSMDDGDEEKLNILFDAAEHQEAEPYTKVSIKPARFPEYSLSELEYILRRHTAVGDFWSCYKYEEGPLDVELTYTDESRKQSISIPNKFWHPADFLEDIQVQAVSRLDVQREVDKGKEAAMPNWIGFGLTDSDVVVEKGKEFSYYALFCRASYYKKLAEKIGLFKSFEEEEEEAPEIPEAQPGVETLSSGIFVSKKGMPLGAVVGLPRTAQAGYWRGIFIMMNCDNFRTEPGRKKLHVEDEQAAKAVAKNIFYKLTKFAHYIIPRDPDEEHEALLRDVDKHIQSVRSHRETHPLSNAPEKIMMYVEPVNEQSLIALFHELIGAGVLKGYKAHRLSAAETYDGIYEYQIEKDFIGNEHWLEWLRPFPARERKDIESKGIYHLDDMIVEFKMHLQDIIKDFLQKSKYHPHIKLIVAWDADQTAIKKKNWLLEDLPRPNILLPKI